MIRAALAALPLLAACGGAADVDQAAPAEAALSATPAEQCGLVLTPDAALLDETTDAAARWSAATGCDVRVGAGGVRVQLVAVIDFGDGLDHPGHVHPNEARMQWVIDVVADRSSAVLPHEIGHVLRLWSPATRQPIHVTDPASLMHDYGGEGLITAADLVYVCEGFPCAAFVPEA